MLLAFSAISCPEMEAQTDSLYMSLDSTTLISRKHTSAIRKSSDGAIDIDIKNIQAMPKILGSVDPVSFIRHFPGVQTSSEYDSGIHINGCDNSHNFISVGGVPVYGANHLFGFFSIFNPVHYGQMSFSSSAERSNRLGGSLTMSLPDTLKKKISGEINTGIMSSEGTLGFRIGRHSNLKVSARQSYMNLLYKRWLKIGGSPIRYGFGDYNLTWLYSKGNDKIWIDAYYGKDKADIMESHLNLSLSADWGNLIGAVHWEHNGNTLRHRHSLFYSRYHSNAGITQDKSYMSLNSYIGNIGYKFGLDWKKFRFGLDASFYDIQPQVPEIHGPYGSNSISDEVLKGFEVSADIGYKTEFADNWEIEAGCRGSMYISPENRCFWGASPNIALNFNAYRFGKIRASYALNHQYLFQTGLSNIGLPIEFWLPAGKYSKPQMSQNIELSYKGEFFRNALAVSASVYYKKLYNQIEYHGDLLDFFTTVYDLDSHLLKGRGYNYGLNLMIHKQTGDITGWISYSTGRARRQFDHPDYKGIYPANHERIHELNAVCTYKFRKWNFAATAVYASGAPFTAPESYYISSGQIITEYGDHNACRMRPYFRLDLSVSYCIIKNDRQENGVNVSLYNATARGNDVMYRISTDRNGTYSYGPMSFFLKLVPSISYYHKF